MANMTIQELSEEDIKLRYITPAILAKGWSVEDITMETKVKLTDGKINLLGNFIVREKPKYADYVLYYNRATPIAIVEAKDATHSVSHGMQQAKGGKVRRLYIPKKLREETVIWLDANNHNSGYLFLNRFGERITPRGISQQLKKYAVKFGLNPKVVYPHSFRHRYAKNFLDRFNDISLLADLMGHESIETTRIYLRRTASEQQAIVDKIITW